MENKACERERKVLEKGCWILQRGEPRVPHKVKRGLHTSGGDAGDPQKVHLGDIPKN